MKRSLLTSVALLTLVALGAAGCATTRQSTRASTVNRPRSFALAVTVHRSLQPTPQQWAGIQAKFAQALAARGWVLVSDVSLADHILRVDFTPNPEDPENGGRAVVLGIRRNPLSTVASRGTSPYPSSAFSYTSSFGDGWSNSNLYSGYDRFGSFYNDGYTGGSTPVAPVAPPRPTPPYRHNPGDRHDCPPERSMPTLAGNFGGNITSPVYDHPRPPPADYGRGSGERTYTRSDGGNNRSYSRADSSYSRSDPFPSRSSYSEPSYSSYSSPSYSSYDSASSSSSASSSAAASTAAASAPPVESVSSAH